MDDEKLNEILSSGQSRYYNQVAWARQYLAWEGLLDTSQHGIWALSSKGETTTLNDDESRAIFLKWVGIHQKSRKIKTEKEIIDTVSTAQVGDLLVKITKKKIGIFAPLFFATKSTGL